MRVYAHSEPSAEGLECGLLLHCHAHWDPQSAGQFSAVSGPSQVASPQQSLFCPSVQLPAPSPPPAGAGSDAVSSSGVGSAPCCASGSAPSSPPASSSSFSFLSSSDSPVPQSVGQDSGVSGPSQTESPQHSLVCPSVQVPMPCPSLGSVPSAGGGVLGPEGWLVGLSEGGVAQPMTATVSRIMSRER